MKNIILSSDGTGNSGGKGNGTNVWRLHTAIERRPEKVQQAHLMEAGPTRQVAFYDDGVGTDRQRWLKIISGAVGRGLSRNVRQLYIQLVSVSAIVTNTRPE